MSRTLPSLLALALIAQLTACAQTDLAPPDAAAAPSAPASAPEVAPVLPPAAPASAPASSAGDGDASMAPPIIIRGTDRVVAPRDSLASKPATDAVSRLQFENAPVEKVVNVMMHDLLKVDYVIHPPLPGAITLTTRETVSADRALLLLETALQANGIVMARDSGGTYHVGTPDALRGIISAPVLAAPGQRLPPGYGAVIIPLQYLGAAEMANILRPLIAPDAILRIDTVRNILVMRGTRAEAEGWLDLVSTFDVNLLRGMSVAIFPLKHTSSSDIQAALEMLSGSALSNSGGAGGAAGGAAAARPATPPMSPQMQAQQRAAGAQPKPASPGGVAEGNPLFGAVRVLPIERLNAVMVVTPRAAYLDEIRYWIEQFDRPDINSREPQLFVYKVQNSSADHLAELLNGIYGGSTATTQTGGATGVAPGLASASGSSGNRTGGNMFGNNSLNSSVFGNNLSGGGSLGGGVFGGGSLGSGGGLGGGTLANRAGGALGSRAGGAPGQQNNGGNQAVGTVSTVTLGQSVRVMSDRINNTLLIYSTPNEYERISATLKRLDVQRAQVLIEASIVEVTLNNDLQYGLEWAFSGRVGGSHNGNGMFSNNATGNPAGGFSGAGAGFSYTLTNAAGTVTAMLQALASQSLIRVISSPSLMVLDNHTAAIQVGNQQPVSTGTVNSLVSDYTSTNIQYKDTGVMLGVTPSINAGDLITMDIDQTVTDLDTSNQSATPGYPTFMQRQISSKVAVRSGETIVLGGLIKDNASNGSSGLPLLSSIPILGALFGHQNKSASRTELLVVITPRVVRSDEDARAVSRELRDRMRGLTAAGGLFAAPTPPATLSNQGANQK